MGTLVGALALGGCGGSRSSSGSGAAPGSGPDRAVQELELVGPPAMLYGGREGVRCPDEPLYSATFATVAARAQAQRVPQPRPDGRLCQVARALAALMLDGLPPPQPAVEMALSHAGVLEPAPHFLVLVGDAGDVRSLQKELERRLPELPLRSSSPRVGLGVAPRPDGLSVIGLLLQDSFLEMESVPRALPAGKRQALRGKVLQPYAEPMVLFTGGDGQVKRLFKGPGREFSATLTCEGEPGRHQVEIMATGPDGPSVIANFPVWCGESPPTHVAVARKTTPTRDPGDAETAVLALVNAERERAGLRPLAWHDDAASVARAHSHDMLQRDVVAHVSPTTGNVTDRVKRAGIQSPLVLENLARAYSPEDVHAGLMNSPGHRQNIMNPDVTHLGIGVALDGRGQQAPALYVTEVFLRELLALDVDQAREQVVALIGERRAQRGRRVPARDGGLDKIAQRLVSELARGKGEVPAQKRDALLQEAASRYRSVGAVVGIMADPKDLASDGLFAEADALGVGVAQGEHQSFGKNAVFVVVLLGVGG